MDNDHILLLKEFVPRDKCDDLIKLFESSPEKMKEGKIGHGSVNLSKKKCVETFYNFYNANLCTLVNEYLPLAIKKYKEKHICVELFPFDIFSHYKVQRYYPTEAYYQLHCENGHPSSNSVLAWMVYLNDVTDDGYTEFPNQGKRFQPRTGDLLIWPAYFTHPHRGIASKTQTKYIVTGWCDYLDKVITDTKNLPNVSYVYS